MKLFKKEKNGNRVRLQIGKIKISYKRALTVEDIIPKIANIQSDIDSIKLKLTMTDNIWKIGNVFFYLPNYPVEYIQTHIVNQQDFFGKEELTDLDELIPENAVILDIGANIGNHSLYWATQRNAKKIYAFEPIKATFDILMKNIELNNLSDIIKPYEVALGEDDSFGEIEKIQYFNMGSTSVKKSEKGDFRIVALDNIKIEEDRIDFVKIDVEGFEPFMLKGAVKTFEKYRPKTIFIEAVGEAIHPVREILESYGYQLSKAFPPYNHLFTLKTNSN